MLEKPKGQSRMDNPKKLSTLGTKDEDNQNKKTQHNMLETTMWKQTQHNMCWRPLCENKHK
jgi:hypothetical protein